MKYTSEQNMLNAQVEYALMTGDALVFTCPRELVEQQNIAYILGYMMAVIRPDEVTDYISAGDKILEAATRHISGAYVIRAISASTIGGTDKVINIVMTTEEDDVENWKLDNPDVFGYVYNVTSPQDSELGYMVFEKRINGAYHRIY